ncbi:PLC-like phosphodiesterase [Phlegmacium glaucopus]|nr:PLC-like phosphodiesterase [Phlegmacium glaucopus]
MNPLYRLLAFLLFLSSILCSSTPFRRATVCNGHSELCNRRYSNVTFIGAHNSYGFSENPLELARDQEVNIPTQLRLGVRLLQAQSHVNQLDGLLHFCHTNSGSDYRFQLLFDGGTVLDYLKIVKRFLDGNPNEVLTLLFTNPEGQSVSDVWKPIFDSAGITPFVYVPPSVPINQSDWPTLGEMIDSGKRVVVFLDAGANTAAVDFILPEFAMIWETPFSVTDPTFPCRVDRIHGPLPTEDHTYIINHSLNKDVIPIGSGSGILVSDPIDAPTTNGADSILAHVNGCLPLGANRNPQFILLDYVDLGEGFNVANRLNGLST